MCSIEIHYAIGYKMLDAERVAAVLREKPAMLHLILTGRNAHPALVELADTVTEMREVKHAYTKGILAQAGDRILSSGRVEPLEPGGTDARLVLASGSPRRAGVAGAGRVLF